MKRAARAIAALRRHPLLVAAAVLLAAAGLGVRTPHALGVAVRAEAARDDESAAARSGVATAPQRPPALDADAAADLASFGLDTPIGRVGGETLRVRDLGADERRAIARVLARIDEAKRAALTRLEAEALVAANPDPTHPRASVGSAAGGAATGEALSSPGAGGPNAGGALASPGTTIDAPSATDAALVIDDASIDAFLRSAPPIPAAAGAPRELARHVLALRARDAARSELLERLRAKTRVERLVPLPAEAAEAPWPEVVARVGDRAITRAEVEHEARLRLFWLRGELVARAALAFSAHTDALLLAREAAARGTTAEQLTAGLAVPASGVAEADVDAELGRRGLSGTARPEQRTRARELVAFRAGETARQALLARLREQTPVVLLLAHPTPPRVEMAGANPGPGDPATTIVAFTNHRCRVCPATSAVLDAIETGRYAGRVRVLRRPLFPEAALPLLIDAMAEACAAEQDADTALRRALLGETPAGAPSGAGSNASGEAGGEQSSAPGVSGGATAASDAASLALGIVPDRERFVRCMADRGTRERILAQRAEAERLGFGDAPGFLVGGLPLTGFQGQERLESILAAELGSAAAPEGPTGPSTGRPR